MEATPDRDSEGFFSGLVNKYDELWKTIIMPTRTKYNLEHLGPEMRRIGDDGVYARKDCQKTNLRGEKLEVTVFSRSPQVTMDKQFMVYLHSHGGSRVEGLGLLPFAWELGMDFCVFDFSGSGMSEGAYTTLGMRESEDCAAVIELLQRDFGATRFVLWGRSMGAVAAILYASGRLPHIRALVLDTPFSTVEAMVRDAGDSYAPLGQYLASFLFGLVKEEIKSKIGQDLSVFSPILTCSKCSVPAIFLAASNDKLVPSVRIEEQFHLWGGSPKEILKIQGSHSSSREADQIRTVIDRLRVILDKSMNAQPSKQDGQGQIKQSLALGPQKPKPWDQKENIRPFPGMVARDDSSPRIHQGSPRTGSQLHQRHMSHIPISSIRREPDQAVQTSPSGDQQGQQYHYQVAYKTASSGIDGEEPKPKDPKLAQNLESITQQINKVGGLYQKLPQKPPGPSKLLQIPSGLAPLTSLSPNSGKSGAPSQPEDAQVWTKLRPDDGGLGYYQKKYIQQQQLEMLQQREQQFMGQPRHSGIPDPNYQARPQSPRTEWNRTETVQPQPMPRSEQSRPEVFSKFAGGHVEHLQSRYQQNVNIRERTPLSFHQHRSVSRTPVTASATPAGQQGLGKWEASIVRDNTLIPVTFPEGRVWQAQPADPWNAQSPPAFSGQSSPRGGTQVGGSKISNPSSYFQRLDNIFPGKAASSGANQNYSDFSRAATLPDSNPAHTKPRSGFKIFEEPRNKQAVSDTHSGGNFQPVDLGWDNSLIVKLQDTSSFSTGIGFPSQQSISRPKDTSGMPSNGYAGGPVGPRSDTSLYNSNKDRTGVNSGSRSGQGEQLQLLNRQSSFVGSRAQDRGSEMSQAGDGFQATRSKIAASPSLNFAAMNSQRQTLQSVFRAPGPSTNYYQGM